jgi:hypothetical protein
MKASRAPGIERELNTSDAQAVAGQWAAHTKVLRAELMLDYLKSRFD